MKSFPKVSLALVVAIGLIGVIHAGYVAETAAQSTRAVVHTTTSMPQI